MKHLTLFLTLSAALLVAPVGAFAKDKCDKDKRESEARKQARLEADRRANGYYTPRYAYPQPYVYVQPRGCDSDRNYRTDSRYRGGYDGRYYSSQPSYYWSR